MSAGVAPISVFGLPFTARPPETRNDMSERSHAFSLDRRTFLKTGVAAGGGLVVSFALPLALRPAMAQPAASPAFAPNAFIRIGPKNVMTLVMPMVEMGQGIYTALAMLLAEELEVG